MSETMCPRCLIPNYPGAERCRFCSELIPADERPQSAKTPVSSGAKTTAHRPPKASPRPPHPIYTRLALWLTTPEAKAALRYGLPILLIVGLLQTCETCLTPTPPSPEAIQERQEAESRLQEERIRLKAAREEGERSEHARWMEEERGRRIQQEKENKLRRSRAVCCCDGTESPTCTYAHSGCCSHHGGVCRCN